MTTGGSTGIPFGFYHTEFNKVVEKAFIHSGWERAGWKLGDSSAILRGAFVGSEDRFWQYDSFNRELLLSSYYLSEDTYQAYMDKISKYKPDHLRAYPSAAVILADLILKRGDAGRFNF